MTKTSRPAFLLAFVLCAGFLLGVAAPASAADKRPRSVTKALDYLSARQLSTGGFAAVTAADAPNITPWAMLAIVAGQEKPAAWNKDGKDPIDYLQALNLEAAANASSNPAAHYAKLILAFTAAVSEDDEEIIDSAGAQRISLLDKLLAFRIDVEDDVATEGVNEDIDGHFSRYGPAQPGVFDVTTTTWALLALIAAEQDQIVDNDYVPETRRWLDGAQNDDGGWPLQTGGTSLVDSTAAAIQALRAAGMAASSDTIVDALAFLRGKQRTDGGFAFGYKLTDVRSNTDSTAMVVMALDACGIDQATWPRNGHTPAEFLRSMQKTNGSFAHSKSERANVMMATTQAVIALAGKSFTFELRGVHLPKHLPSFSSFKPANGAAISTTNDVTVEVRYTDPPGGTGIDKDAVRVVVDTVNKTKNARVYSGKLYLKLVDLKYGQHAIEVRIADKAGNTRTSTHTITVSYNPTPSSTPTAPATLYPTVRPTTPTTLYPTPRATPTTASTMTPVPVPSDSGAVTGTVLTPFGSPTPSASGSPSAGAAGDGSGGDSGGSAALLGATLLAMLPLGAGLSHWLQRRQDTSLSKAGQGRLLAGGGSPWQRFKSHLPGVS